MSQQLKEKIIEEIRWVKKKSYEQANNMGITEGIADDPDKLKEATEKSDPILGQEILNALNRIFQLTDELDVSEGKPLQR